MPGLYNLWVATWQVNVQYKCVATALPVGRTHLRVVSDSIRGALDHPIFVACV